MCLKQLVCDALGGGGPDGMRLISKACFFLSVVIQFAASQQSTRRRLDLVKEFLREKSKMIKNVLLQLFFVLFC